MIPFVVEAVLIKDPIRKVSIVFGQQLLKNKLLSYCQTLHEGEGLCLTPPPPSETPGVLAVHTRNQSVVYQTQVLEILIKF